MYKVLDKDTIMIEMVPYLPKQIHGPSPRAPIAEIVNAVFYKLKSGVQWHMLLFNREPLHYKTVFRSVLNRFDTTITSWMGFNFLVFTIIAIKKFKKITNSR